MSRVIICDKSLGACSDHSPVGEGSVEKRGPFLHCFPTYRIFSYTPDPHTNAGRVAVISE